MTTVCASEVEHWGIPDVSVDISVDMFDYEPVENAAEFQALDEDLEMFLDVFLDDDLELDMDLDLDMDADVDLDFSKGLGEYLDTFLATYPVMRIDAK